jgi:hypothetical protein
MQTPNYIETRIGDTISYAGTVNLPAGNWSAEVHGAGITATLSLVGPDSSDPTRSVWTIALEATSTATAVWHFDPSKGTPNVRKVAIRFIDDSNPPIVKTSETFDLRVYP